MPKTINRTSKKTIFLISACAVVFAMSAGISFAEINKGPTDMVLKTAKAKKPAVFPHSLHQGVLACADCHHGKDAAGAQKPYEEGQEIGKCESCHNNDMPNKKLNNFKNVGHENCKSCHSDMAKAGQKTGPTKCNGCHQKI